MNPQPTEIERRYGAKAAQEWSYVLDFLELQTGFSSNLILVPDASAARVCAAELEAFLKTKGQRLEKIEFNTPQDLQEHFAPWLLEGAKRDGAGAVWLASVSSAFDPQHSKWQSAWRYATARVNERRDELIRRYQIPIFVATAAWTNETIRQAAPDWWSVRSLVVRLKPEITPSDFRPEQRERALEMGRLTLQEDYSGDELLDPDIALETAAQLRGIKGEEKTLIRMLERAYEGLVYRDRYAEAEAVAREGLAIEDVINAPIVEKANSLQSIGIALLYQSRLEEAEKAFRTALEWQETGGDSLANHGITMHNLGRVLLDSGRFEEAEKAFRTALEWKETGGDSFTSRAITMHELGRVLRDSGRLEEAEKAFRTALEWQETGGDSLTSRGITMHNLGRVLRDSGRFEEAEKAFRTALEWKETGNGSLTSRAISMDLLGRVLRDSGRLEEAEKAFRTALEWAETSGESLTSRAISMDLLGRVLLDSGRLEEAEKAFRTALEWQEMGGDSITNRGITMDLLGRVLYEFGHLEKAERALLQSIEMGIQGGDKPESIQNTRDVLVQVQQQLNPSLNISSENDSKPL